MVFFSLSVAVLEVFDSCSSLGFDKYVVQAFGHCKVIVFLYESCCVDETCYTFEVLAKLEVEIVSLSWNVWSGRRWLMINKL